MPTQREFKTDRTGVFYIMGRAPGGGEERIYYIRFKLGGRLIVEKAGRAGQGMTPAKASRLRADKISGRIPTNKDRREAEKARKQAEADRWTLSRLWREYASQRPLTKTLMIDQGRFDKYLKEPFGDKEPGEIDPLSVDRLRVAMGKRLAPQTVKHVLNLLDKIVNFGVASRLNGPLSFKVKKPQVDNIKTEDLTPEQIRRLLEVIETDPHPVAGPMMKMALLAGMRRGEMLKLQWADVDFERGFITIRNPKGGKDQVIPLSDAARAILNDLPRTSEYVFPGRDGNQRVEIHNIVRRIADKAGLPKGFRPLHGLRHVYASMLASSGQVDMYVLQRLLTHKSPLMTQRYAHLRDETLKQASNLAGRLVEQALSETEKETIDDIPYKV